MTAPTARIRKGTPARPAGVTLCLAALLLAPGAHADTGLDPEPPASPPPSVLTLLNRRGMPTGTPEIEAAILTAILTALDPFHRWVTPSATPEPPTATPDATTWPLGLRYLRLPNLNDEAARLAESHLQTWAGESVNGLILDLRGATGDSAAAIDRLAAHFTSRSTTNLTYHLIDGQGRPLEEHAVPTNTPALPPSLPCAILVDGQTRGGAEILAALLGRIPGILLMGAPTAGDGALRETIPIDAARRLYIATRWGTPDGHPALRQTPLAPPLAPATSPDTTRFPFPPTVDGEPNPKRTHERRDAFEALAQHTLGDPLLSRAADTLIALHSLHAPDTKRTAPWP